MRRLFIFLIPVLLFFSSSGKLIAQQGLDNPTRALFIMDIAKYVEWPADIMLNAEEFSIAVLSKNDELYWDLEHIAKNRRYVQGKPVRIFLFRNLDQLQKTHVLYLDANEGFKIKEVLGETSGNHTLVMSEGFDFRRSMINFLLADGKPKFEVNEELINKEGLKVSELFLTLAVKTREDWESLFNLTDEQLKEEKEVTRQQSILLAQQEQQIEDQKALIAAQLLKLDSLDKAIASKQENINSQHVILLDQKDQIEIQKARFELQEEDIRRQTVLLDEKQKILKGNEKTLTLQQARIDEQDEMIIAQLEQINKQKLVMYFTLFALLLVAAIGYFIYVNYRNKKEANKILQNKNKEISLQKEEIRKQRDIAELQRDQIAYQKKHITDSIEYARKIQTAILPSLELFSDKIEHFVLYKPRDIVSGDFYWVNEFNDKYIIITADCTGHGVPGAFMSMLGVSLLNEIVNNNNIHRPDLILNELRAAVIDSLKQMERDSVIKDGMDMTVCTFYPEEGRLEFAGANNHLLYINNGEVVQVKGDKMPVAVYDKMEPFKLHRLNVEKGDCLYTYSDGYVDQFGGPNQKKFLGKRFKELLYAIHHERMIDQGVILNEKFEEWKKDVDQVDDVTVIGLRI